MGPVDGTSDALVLAFGRYGRTSLLMKAVFGTFPMWTTLGCKNAPALNGMNLLSVSGAAPIEVVAVVWTLRSRRSLPEVWAGAALGPPPRMPRVLVEDRCC